MKMQPVKEQAPQIVWRESQKTLTLTGEPVLELKLSWPQGEGKGPLIHSVSRYYARLARCWQKRWERESYLCACADLAQKRERSKPFAPWTADLSGRVGLDNGEYLSIAMRAREIRGDGRTLEYRWGDTWSWQDGAAVPLKELYEGEKGWRKRLRRELDEAAQRSRGGGVYLDRELAKPLRRWFSPGRVALTGEGMEVYYPQCTLAPAVEGAPVLLLPLPALVRPDREEKKEA